MRRADCIRTLALVEPAPIRVLVTGVEPVVCMGLHAMLIEEPDLVIVGSATAAGAAVALARELRPDVALVDLELPGALEAARRVHAAGVAVVMLAADDRDDVLLAALRAGARAFLPRSPTPAALAQAVRSVSAGDARLSPRAVRRLIDAFVAPSLRPAPEREGGRRRLHAVPG